MDILAHCAKESMLSKHTCAEKSPWPNVLIPKCSCAGTSAELNLARAVMSLAEMVGCQLQREGDKMSYFLAN